MTNILSFLIKKIFLLFKTPNIESFETNVDLSYYLSLDLKWILKYVKLGKPKIWLMSHSLSMIHHQMLTICLTLKLKLIPAIALEVVVLSTFPC